MNTTVEHVNTIDMVGGDDAQALERKVPVDHVEEIEGVAVDGEPTWQSGWRLWLALLGLMSAQLVTAMGGNMISPAFNIIVNDFNAGSKFGWIGSAFFMAQCPCMLLFGQLLSAFDGKKIVISAVALFSLGSVVCGSAQTIIAVIVGRAVSGIGAAGIWVGVLSLIAAVSPLKDRPRVLGIFGLINAVACGAGPPFAGYFADQVTWRLCFLFTLPLAVLAVVAVWFLVPEQDISKPFGPSGEAVIDARYKMFSSSEPNRNSALYRLLGVDWVGFALICLSVICLQLSIQWGGSVYSWTSPTILGLVIGGFFGIALLFVAWEYRCGEGALMPLFLFRIRTQYGSCLLSMLCLYANLIGTIMLPYFFEVVFNRTALQAGYEILPYLLVTIIFSLASGFITSATGHFWPWLIVGPSFMIVSGAMYYTLQTSASAGQLYGYQILLAAAVGLTQQQVYVAIQSVSEQKDVHLRIAAVSFSELFGGAIAPTVSTSILSNQLVKNLAKYAPNAPASVSSDTAVIATLPAELQAAVRTAYIYSLHPVFLQLCALGGLSLIVVVALVKPVNVKKVQTVNNAH